MKKGDLIKTEQYKPNTAVQLTGEFRTPKRGEYFISGAIPTGYLALNDLNRGYYIGKLVRVKRVTNTVVIEEL